MEAPDTAAAHQSLDGLHGKRDTIILHFLVVVLGAVNKERMNIDEWKRLTLMGSRSACMESGT